MHDGPNFNYNTHLHKQDNELHRIPHSIGSRFSIDWESSSTASDASKIGTLRTRA